MFGGQDSYGVRRIPGSRETWALVLAIGIAVAAVIPSILTGALSSRMRGDLDLTNRALGVAVAAFYFSGSLASLRAGRIVQRLGVSRGMRLSGLLSLVSLSGMALVVRSSVGLTVFLMVGGLAIATAQPAANMAILENASRDREGLIFGLKQGALPVAALLSGLAVPAIALTLGWRWAYGCAALVPLCLIALPYRSRSTATDVVSYQPATKAAILGLVPVVFAAALGAMAGNAVGTFLVPSLVDSGFTESFAGFALALGGLSGIAGRIGSGWVSDRVRQSPLKLAAAMLIVGALGFVLLAFPLGWTALPASVLAFGFGWGWPGLVHTAVATSHRGSVGEATALLNGGSLLGAGLGPLLLGILATAVSFEFAWGVAAVVAVIASGLLLLRARAADEMPFTSNLD